MEASMRAELIGRRSPAWLVTKPIGNGHEWERTSERTCSGAVVWLCGHCGEGVTQITMSSAPR